MDILLLFDAGAGDQKADIGHIFQAAAHVSRKGNGLGALAAGYLYGFKNIARIAAATDRSPHHPAQPGR
jgi:hypothetical protein